MAARRSKNKLINLLPSEDFDKTTLGRVLKWALTTFRYIVIFVELIVVGGFLSRFYFDVQIGNLNDEIKQQSAVIAAKHPTLEEPFRKIQLKLSILSSIGDESNSVLPMIDALAENIPYDSRILRISKDSQKVTIQMASVSEGSALFFLDSLSRNQAFSNLEIIRVESEIGSPFINYTLEGDLNYTN